MRSLDSLPVTVFSRSEFPTGVADHLERLLVSLTQGRETVNIALSGGRTPRSVYPLLVNAFARRADEFQIFFTDERPVGPSHRDSNYRLVVEMLTDPAGIARTRVHRAAAERRDVLSAAREYSERLPERLDLALLGVGEDYHTASLFPGDKSAWASEGRAIAVDGPEKTSQRITLTPGYLKMSRHLCVMACGAKKAHVVERAFAQDRDLVSFPVQLLSQARWLIDEAAAGGAADVR